MAASKVFIVAVAIMLLGFYFGAIAETGTVGNESGEMKSLLSLRLSSRTLLPQITSKKLFQNGCDGNPCINYSCYYLLNGCTCNRDTNECFKEAVPPPAEYVDTFDVHEEPDIADDRDEENDQEIDNPAEEIDQEIDGQEAIRNRPPNWNTDCSVNDCLYHESGYGTCIHTREWNLICRCINRTGKCGRYRKPKL